MSNTLLTKIKYVTAHDREHALRPGEFALDSETNTLYVGKDYVEETSGTGESGTSVTGGGGCTWLKQYFITGIVPQADMAVYLGPVPPLEGVVSANGNDIEITNKANVDAILAKLAELNAIMNCDGSKLIKLVSADNSVELTKLNSMIIQNSVNGNDFSVESANVSINFEKEN